jgi:polyisoprenoid-binding protein YceI
MRPGPSCGGPLARIEKAPGNHLVSAPYMSRMNIQPLALVVALVASPLVWAQGKPKSAAAEQRYGFNDPNSRDTVTFLLDAPLETINGLSNSVKGRILLREGKATGELRVPVSTLKTGNATRDGHLQNDRWLDAAKFPDIIAAFEGLSIPELEDGKPQKVETKVRLTVRGVTLEHPVEVMVTRFKESELTRARAPGDLLRIRAKFRVPLEDHGIKREGPLRVKVAEVAEVSVDAWGSSKFGP